MWLALLLSILWGAPTSQTRADVLTFQNTDVSVSTATSFASLLCSSGQSSVSVYVTATATSFSITPQVSNDGTNWGTLPGSSAITSTGPQAPFSLGSYLYFRLNVTAISGGSVTVSDACSAATGGSGGVSGAVTASQGSPGPTSAPWPVLVTNAGVPVAPGATAAPTAAPPVVSYNHVFGSGTQIWPKTVGVDQLWNAGGTTITTATTTQVVAIPAGKALYAYFIGIASVGTNSAAYFYYETSTVAACASSATRLIPQINTTASTNGNSFTFMWGGTGVGSGGTYPIVPTSVPWIISNVSGAGTLYLCMATGGTTISVFPLVMGVLR